MNGGWLLLMVVVLCCVVLCLLFLSFFNLTFKKNINLLIYERINNQFGDVMNLSFSPLFQIVFIFSF